MSCEMPQRSAPRSRRPLLHIANMQDTHTHIHMHTLCIDVTPTRRTFNWPRSLWSSPGPSSNSPRYPTSSYSCNIGAVALQFHCGSGYTIMSGALPATGPGSRMRRCTDCDPDMHSASMDTAPLHAVAMAAAAHLTCGLSCCWWCCCLLLLRFSDSQRSLPNQHWSATVGQRGGEKKILLTS